MNIRKIGSLGLITVGMVITSCAPKSPPPPPPATTPFVGSETLTITSDPSKANVKLSTGERCVTPCSLTKNSDESFTVSISKENYNSQTVKVTNNLDVLRDYNRRRGVSELDVSQLNVDALRLVPNPVHVNLDPDYER